MCRRRRGKALDDIEEGSIAVDTVLVRMSSAVRRGQGRATRPLGRYGPARLVPVAGTRSRTAGRRLTAHHSPTIGGASCNGLEFRRDAEIGSSLCVKPGFHHPS